MTTVQGRWVLGGGIGSGKSQVRRILESLGVRTIDADSVGHQVLESDGPAYGDVVARWPQVVSNGVIDRQRLGGIVFQSPEDLAELEGLTHHHIFRLITQRAEEGDGGLVVEMPILGRLPGLEWRLMVVDTRDEIRVKRAVARGMAEAEVRARMASQPSRGEWLAAADAVLPNHGSISELEIAVQALVPHI